MKTQSFTQKDSRGYTLLEVMLFMAISSALALIAFAGLGPRLRNVRFTDAARAVQSDMTQEIVNAQEGQNRRSNGFNCKKDLSGQLVITTLSADNTNDGGSSQDCIINGKLAEVNTDGITYYSIVSLRTPAISCPSIANTFADITNCFKPHIVQSFENPAPVTKKYKNGLTASGIDATPFPLRFGYIQNPNGTEKYYFTHESSIDAGNSDSQSITSADKQLTKDQGVCLALTSRSTELIFSPGSLPQLKSEGCR